MADFLDTVQKVINTPPGQLVAGGVLATIVWKFFERVEVVLTDQTKKEIARWLRVKNVETGILTATNWPDTFARVFDRVFGSKHLSLECFSASCLATVASYGLTIVLLMFLGKGVHWSRLPGVLSFALISVFPDYLSLLKTRWFVSFLGRHKSPILHVLVLGVDFIIGCCLSVASSFIAIFGLATVFRHYLPLMEPPPTPQGLHNLAFAIVVLGILISVPNILASSFTSFWVWLYVGSGFLLRLARRFDLGFEWFNTKFDIEKKPLSSIGLVAGALVALSYWGVVGGVWIVQHLKH